MARRFVLKARTAAVAVDFSRELNEEQLAVATAPGGPMLVVAGAGTGKTRALTYRLAWLVAHGVDPSRILLVTFTNRAAREMLHRVEALVHERTRRLWAGTFHHIGHRILRQYAGKLGIRPDFSIIDRGDARDLMGSCLVQAGIDVRRRRFPQKSVLVSISSFLQNALEPLEAVLAKRYPMFLDDAERIRRVLEVYAARKKERGLVDYDDLLTGWLVLLKEHPDVREALAEQFHHILVDEYQDTNAIQGEIVDLLAAKHRNLCVVGDDSQAIFSFRGASFQNIVTFPRRYPDATIYRLETNYRSTPEILALANASIARNTRRLPKNLRAVRPSGLKPALVPCHDHFVQSRFVAEYILHLLDDGRELRDIAVLYRSHWNALEIQLELQRRKIPFRVRGGLRFFEQAHIKDVLAFLRIVNNPRDELSWRRILQMLPRVGTRLAERLWEHVAGAAHPLEEALKAETEAVFPSDARPFYRELARHLRGLAALTAPADMIEFVMREFYDDYLVSHYDGATLRREDIRGFASFASQYNTLEAFLADVALAGEYSGETVVAGPVEDEFVTLSTVHQAKGLEWPVVIIPWLADGRFPTDFAINTLEDEEEERRVFHVAVTRAKDELYLVVPQFHRMRGGGNVIMKPSRFIMELSPDAYERMELEEGLPEVITGAAAQPGDGRDRLPPSARRELPLPEGAAEAGHE